MGSGRMSVTITSPELTQWQRMFTPKETQRILAKPINAAQKEVTRITKNAARREVARHRQSGKLRSLIRTRNRGSGFALVAGVKSAGGVSNLIVGGVVPHRIAPGGVMPLWGGRGSFFTPGGKVRKNFAGITGFASVVQHPGFAADPFFARAIDDTEAERNRILQDAADGMARDLARALGG
jgi:hypothetical protein